MSYIKHLDFCMKYGNCVCYPRHQIRYCQITNKQISKRKLGRYHISLSFIYLYRVNQFTCVLIMKLPNCHVIRNSYRLRIRQLKRLFYWYFSNRAMVFFFFFLCFPKLPWRNVIYVLGTHCSWATQKINHA